jgi:hypothetical protein
MGGKMGLKKWLSNIFNKNNNSDTNIKDVLVSNTSNRVIDNLILADNNGKISKIDYVLMRNNGIFCIVEKNLPGQLFGNIDNEYWNQCTFDCKYRFTNPIKQNKKNIYHINKILNNKYKVNSLIVLNHNNGNNIKIDNVVNLNNLKNYLDTYNDNISYNNEEIEDMYKLLLDAKEESKNKINVKDNVEVDSLKCIL